MRRSLSDDEDFFYWIRNRVCGAFDQSPVKQLQEQRGEHWAWSVCDLPLRRGADLLLGLNWGRKKGKIHSPQNEPPTPEQIKKVRLYHFIRRSIPLLLRHGLDIERMNYLNVCPFRSPQAADLTPEDWRLAIENFFIDTLDYLSPPRTVILGTTVLDQLKRHVSLSAQPRISVTARFFELSGSQQAWAYRGQITGRSGQLHPFVAVPHPNRPLQTKARRRLWGKVFRIVN